MEKLKTLTAASRRRSVLAGRPEMTRRTSDPSVLPKTDDLGEGRRR
jgi:hypothetical protein